MEMLCNRTPLLKLVIFSSITIKRIPNKQLLKAQTVQIFFFMEVLFIIANGLKAFIFWANFSGFVIEFCC